MVQHYRLTSNKLKRKVDTLFQFFKDLAFKFRRGSPASFYAPLLQMLAQSFFSFSVRNRSAPFIRTAVNVQDILNNFIIATLPCWLIGLWNLGYQSNLAIAELGLEQLPGWRGGVLSGTGIGYDAGNIFACFLQGLLYFLPIFLVVLLVSAFWEVIFSSVRRRPVNQDILTCAWLFALALPAGAPLYQIGIGVTFGMVIGKHVYGGYGRYLVNPTLLGLIFLWLAYPDLVFGQRNWVPVPGSLTTSVMELAAAGGVAAVLESGQSWWQLFLGARPGPIGMTSVLGSLLGATYLIVTASASWRVMAGALLGTMVTVFLFNYLAGDNNPLLALPLRWHMVLGGLAFGAVFFATDPVAAATTNSGRWAFGVFVGLLTILIRVANPSITESILFAVFLASLLAPLIDFCVIQLHIRRRRQRLSELTHGQ